MENIRVEWAKLKLKKSCVCSWIKQIKSQKSLLNLSRHDPNLFLSVYLSANKYLHLQLLN